MKPIFKDYHNFSKELHILAHSLKEIFILNSNVIQVSSEGCDTVKLRLSEEKLYDTCDGRVNVC